MLHFFKYHISFSRFTQTKYAQLPLLTVHRVPIRSIQVFNINFQRVHRSVVELVEEARVEADRMGGLFEMSLVLLYFYRPTINFTGLYKKKK